MLTVQAVAVVKILSLYTSNANYLKYRPIFKPIAPKLKKKLLTYQYLHYKYEGQSNENLTTAIKHIPRKSWQVCC